MTPRTYLLIAGLLAPMTALVAQVPPPATPPVAPPAPTTAAPRPTPTVRVLEPGAYISRDEIRALTDEARAAVENARLFAPRAVDMENLAQMAREQAIASIDRDAIRQATEAARAVNMMDMETMRMDAERMRLDSDRIREEALHLAQVAPRPMSMPDFNFDFHFDAMMPTHTPSPARFYQGEPGDSLYRRANDLFQRQEYRQAANLFSEVRTKYPTSRYFCEASYWEAFARQRLGLPEDLRTGKKVIEGMTSKCSQRSQDVPGVLFKINKGLANLGDRDAADAVQRALSAGNVCDPDDRSVKMAALNAIAQNDPDGAPALVKGMLAKTDECSASLRGQALRIVARRNDADAVAVLVSSAKNDPSKENRRIAISALGSMSGDPAFAALEDFLRNSNDESIQRAAASAMAESDNPRAQAAVRALIGRKEVSEAIRVSAIQSLGSQSMLPPDIWKSMYASVESEALRSSVIGAIPRSNLSDETQQWLVGIAKNTSEPPPVRSAALRKVSSTAPIKDLMEIFRTADSRSMRQSIVSGFSSRRDQEATDALIDIAKNSSDPEIRQQAINALSSSSRKDDPKVKKTLCEILSGGSC